MIPQIISASKVYQWCICKEGLYIHYWLYCNKIITILLLQIKRILVKLPLSGMSNIAGIFKYIV